MCQIFFFLVFLLSMVGDPYEDFLTVPTGIINNIFVQQMINLNPVKDGFLLGSYLGSSTIYTGKIPNYLNGNMICFLLYRRIIALFNSHFPKLANFSLNGATPKTNYGNIYVKNRQSVMSKQEFSSFSSADMLIITTPTKNVICECNTHMINKNLLFNKTSTILINRNFVIYKCMYTSANFTEECCLALSVKPQVSLNISVHVDSSELILFSVFLSFTRRLQRSWLVFSLYTGTSLPLFSLSV